MTGTCKRTNIQKKTKDSVEIMEEIENMEAC